MSVSKSTLSDQDRAKLDNIVSQMERNGEPEENIRFVVEDFKNKYGLKKKEEPTTSSVGVGEVQPFRFPFQLQPSGQPSLAQALDPRTSIPQTDPAPQGQGVDTIEQPSEFMKAVDPTLRNKRQISIPGEGKLTVDTRSFPVSTVLENNEDDYLRNLQKRINENKLTDIDKRVISKNRRSLDRVNEDDVDYLEQVANHYGVTTEKVSSQPIPEELKRIFPDVQGNVIGDIADDNVRSYAQIQFLKNEIQKSKSQTKISTAGLSLTPFSKIEGKDEAGDDILEQLGGIESKIAFATAKIADPTDQREAKVRREEPGSNWERTKRFFTRAIAATGSFDQFGKTMAETEYVKTYFDKLPSQLITGLNYLKVKDPVQAERVLAAIANKQPLSESQVSNLVMIGTEVEAKRLQSDFEEARLTPEQYTETITQLKQIEADNILNRKETLVSYLSSGIAEKADQFYAATSAGDVSGAKLLLGFKWGYSDEDIDLFGRAVARENGWDINDARVKKAIQYLKDNEGSMIGDNSIYKSGILRHLGAGIARPFAGIGAAVDMVGRDSSDQYAHGQSAGNVNVAETPVKRIEGSVEGSINKMMEGVGELASQATLGYIGGAGLGTIAPALGVGTRQGIATVLTAYGQSVEGHANQALTYTSDNAEAELIAHTLGMVDGLTENLLSPVGLSQSIIKSLRSPDVTKGLLGLMKNENVIGRKNAIAEFLKSTMRGAIGGGKVVLAETSEEAISAIADFGAQAMTDRGAKSFEDRSLLEELKTTAIETGLSMAIPALGAGIGAANVNTFGKSSLLVAAQNRTRLLDQLNKLKAVGDISDTEYNEKAQIINTASKVNDNLPLKEDGKTKLNTEEKANYIFSRVSEALLNEKKMAINDEAEKDVLEEKIKREQDYRKSILRNEKPVVTTEAKDAEAAQSSEAKVAETENAPATEAAKTNVDPERVADIERRRKAELDQVEDLPSVERKDMTPEQLEKEQQIKTQISQINSKYNAELEGTTPKSTQNVPAPQVAIDAINALEGNPKVPAFELEAMKQDPAASLKMIADQVLGFGRDTQGNRVPLAGTTGRVVEGSEAQSRQKYGDELVDLALKMHPAEQQAQPAQETQPAAQQGIQLSQEAKSKFASIKDRKQKDRAEMTMAERLQSARQERTPVEDEQADVAEWQNLSMQEKLSLAKQTLPPAEIDGLTDQQTVEVADRNASILLAARRGEQPAALVETAPVIEPAPAAVSEPAFQPATAPAATEPAAQKQTTVPAATKAPAQPTITSPNTLTVPSKSGAPIEYFRKEDGWYFVNSRGRDEKETKAKQEELDRMWQEGGGRRKRGMAAIKPKGEFNRKELSDKVKPFTEKAKKKKYANPSEFAKAVLPKELYEKYKFLYELADKLGIIVDTAAAIKPESMAQYGANTVEIGEKTIQLSSSIEEFTDTLNHEIVHGLLTPRQGGLTFAARDNLHKKLGEVFEIVRANFDNASPEVQNTIAYIADTAKDNILSDTDSDERVVIPGDYEELVTYALTDPEFAQFLSSIQMPGQAQENVTLWGRLKQLVLEAIQTFTNNKSALDTISEILDEGFSTDEAADNFRWDTQAKSAKGISQVIEKLLGLDKNRVVPIGVAGEVQRAERKFVLKVAKLAEQFVKQERKKGADLKELLSYDSIKRFAESIGQQVSIGVVEGYNEGVTGIRLPNRNEVWLPMGAVEEQLNKLFSKTASPTSKQLSRFFGDIKVPDYDILKQIAESAYKQYRDQADWYVHAADLAKGLVGEQNMNEFGAIWGITSAQSTVATNLQKVLWAMMNARRFDLNTQAGVDGFTTAFKSAMPNGSKPLITGNQISKIINFYKGEGYVSESNVKTYVYSKLTADRGRSTFNPFSVMDTHMMRFFGASNMKSSTVTDEQIGKALNSVNTQRAGMYLTAKLAKDFGYFGIRADQMQAMLWFHAKHNYGRGVEKQYAGANLFSIEQLDEMKVVSNDGSIDAAYEDPKTKPVVDALNRMKEDGDFNINAPYNDLVNDSPFGYISGKNSDIYSTYLYSEELEKVASLRYKDGAMAVSKTAKIQAPKERVEQVMAEKSEVSSQAAAYKHRGTLVRDVDVYQMQDETSERIISDKNRWKYNGGQVWRFKFENAGDILRELAKYKNQFLDPSYIYEKVNYIEDFIAKLDRHHPSERYNVMAYHNKEVLKELRDYYEIIPPQSNAQAVAKELVLNLIDGNIPEAQKNIEYFNRLREGDTRANLMAENRYDLLKRGARIKGQPGTTFKVGITNALNVEQVEGFKELLAPEQYQLLLEVARKKEEGNRLEKEGDFAGANKLYNEILDVSEQRVKELFSDVPELTVTIKRTKGNFFASTEPSFEYTIEDSDSHLTTIIARLADVANNEFKQDSVHVSEVLDIPQPPDGQEFGVQQPDLSVYEPNVDMRFANELTEQQAADIEKLIQDTGLAGSTRHSDNKGLSLYNISNYKPNEEFVEQSEKVIQELVAAGVQPEVRQNVRRLWNIGKESGAGFITYEQAEGLRSQNKPTSAQVTDQDTQDMIDIINSLSKDGITSLEQIKEIAQQELGEDYDEAVVENAFNIVYPETYSEEPSITIDEAVEQIKSGKLDYKTHITGKDDDYISNLDAKLFGNKKAGFDYNAFKTQVKRQKDIGMTRQEIVEGFESVKKLTKAQQEAIDEVFAEEAEKDNIAADLQEAFDQIAKGLKPKAVLERLSVSNVSNLVAALRNRLAYRAISNKELDDITDYIVASMDLTKSDQYINAIINNADADVKQLLRAKIIIELQNSGNTDLARQITLDMADDAVLSGRQTQSLKRAYELLGAKGNATSRTLFMKRAVEAVQKKASGMNQHLSDLVSEKNAEISKLNEKIHEMAQKSSGMSKIKDLINKLCNIRNKK